MSLSSRAVQPVVPSGVPCWIELACSDEAVMQNFYGRLFGWDYELRRDPATPTGRYSIASLGGVQVGGLYRAPAESARGWTVHLAVQQAASAAEWVESLGGRVTLGPVEVPGRGNILHAVDPTGAPVVFWEPSATWEFGVGVPHTFSGADLNTHDGEGADYFYCKLFNYVSQQIGDAVTVDYVAWHIDRFPVLYRYVMGPEYSPDTPPHWMIYFVVDPARGTDATAGQAIMLGGNVVIQPYDSAFGRMAILADPEGAVFAVIEHSQATDSGRAEVDDPYDD